MAKKVSGNPNKAGSQKSETRADYQSKSKNYRGNSANNRKHNSDYAGAKRGRGVTNDISWYSKNPELLSAAARIPFPFKPGMKVSAGSQQFSVTDNHNDVQYGPVTAKWDKHIPGVIALNYIPSIGWSNGPTSPASITARELFSTVRSKFSGALDADGPDLLMFNIAVANVHAYIAHLKRIYGLLNLYTPENRTFPDLILSALGIDSPDDWRAEKTKLWGNINTLINMINKFSLVKGLPMYERAVWLSERVYQDAPTAASQTYVFNPMAWYVVTYNGSTGTELSLSPFRPDDVDSALTIGLDMISKISDWEDSYVINGYFMRAFEGSELYTTPLLDADYVTEIAYDEVVLSQIENAVCVHNVDRMNMRIKQDPATNSVIARPHSTQSLDLVNPNGHMVYKGDVVINLHLDAPTAADVVEATRLVSVVVTEDDEIYEGTVAGDIVCGTEIIEQITLYRLPGEGLVTKVDLAYAQFINLDSSSLINFDVYVGAALEKSAFSHAPITWLIVSSSSIQPAGTSRVFMLCDVANLTTIQRSQMAAINEVCLYSLFNCFNK